MERPATKRMVDFAADIAMVLSLTEPNYSSFTDTSMFISNNIDKFNSVVSYRRFESSFDPHIDYYKEE